MASATALNSYALVLNKNWLAIGVTTVRHAVCLLFTGNAHAIHPETLETHDFQTWADLHVSDNDSCVRSVSLRIRVPEIIQLRTFTGVPKRRVVFSRRNIFRRDHYTCQHCGNAG